MAEDYERANARLWDQSLQDDSNISAPPPSQQQQQQHILPQPLVRLPPPQSARSVDPRDHQRRPRPDQTTGGWQGVLPKAPPRRRIGVGSDGDKSVRAMPKISSQTAALKTRNQLEWEADVKRMQLRHNPPCNREFQSIGTFHWPSKEYRPEEVLGPAFEALDPIRMRTSCFIVWKEEDSSFQVFGKISRVQKALAQLRLTCFQIASVNIDAVRKYYTHWPTEQPCLYVHLDEEYDNPQVIMPPGEPPVEPSKTPRGDGEMINQLDLEKARTLETCSKEGLKLYLAQSICKIHYLRGHIRFRIRLGTSVLTSHLSLRPSESWDLDDFTNMTALAQFRGRVTQELGDKTTESNVLARLQQADGLLQPHDAMLDKLSEVKATYSADFVFKTEAGALQLTMSWDRIQDRTGGGSQFVLKEEKWTGLDRDTGKASDLVDMSLTDLHTGSAWQFDIQTSRAIDSSRVPAGLKKFGRGVTISIKETPDRPTVTWTHTVCPEYARDRTIYRYNISETDYTLELSNFQIREIAPRQSPIMPPQAKLYEKRWGLSVYRTEWDNHFALNERLKIGERAGWDDAFEEWFPRECSWEGEGKCGFEQLMQKLVLIEKLVRA